MKTIRNALFMLKYPGRFIPVQTFMYVLLEVLLDLNGIFLEIILVKVIMDAVQYNEPFQNILLKLLVFASYFVSVHFAYNLFMSVVWEKAVIKLNHNIQLIFNKRAQELDVCEYDNVEFYDSSIKSVSVCGAKVMDVLNSVTNLFRMLARLIFVVAFLSFINVYVMILILGSCVVSLFINKKTNKISYAQYLENMKYDKRLGYIGRIFSGIEYVKDIRMFSNFKNVLFSEHITLNKEKKAITNKYWKILYICYLAVEYLLGNFVLRGVVILFVAYQIIVSKSLPYSAFAIMIPSILDLNDSMRNLVSILPQFIEYNYHIENIKMFLSKRSRMKYQPALIDNRKNSKSIELKNVSFAYDGELVLKNINLCVKPNERLAIVGSNGAGKSTLIKLITRLYEPTEGNVFLDGNDAACYKKEDYRAYFKTLFQDFRLFAFSVAENVLMDVVDKKDADIVNNAIQQSGFKEVLENIGKDINSVMTKMFDKDGLILSGGETQKLAISRVFTKEDAILILDEPSSSLDPVSEYKMNDLLINSCPSCTVIFISHRLSTTRRADRIIMLSDGEIIEEGSHDELMDLNGRYAEMFNLQAQNYRKEN
jgi:ATP-binding cassette subfamily B protein